MAEISYGFSLNLRLAKFIKRILKLVSAGCGHYAASGVMGHHNMISSTSVVIDHYLYWQILCSIFVYLEKLQYIACVLKIHRSFCASHCNKINYTDQIKCETKPLSVE